MARYQKPVLNLVADNVWGAACQAQRINGSYVKLSVLTEEDKSSNKLSNRQLIETFMVDSSLITKEDMAQGKKVRAFYQAFTFKILQGKRLSEFDNTAMLIANRDIITSAYDVAVIASLPSSYERGIKKQSVEQRINFARGGFIGSPGNKVSTAIEVLKSVYSVTWNTHYITGINGDDQVVFFAFKEELPVGKFFDIYGTVKAHRDNSAQLNRVKVIK
jgi:catabolite regulation protein CreA